MRTESAALSDIGRKRAANEDFFAVEAARDTFVVADGLGGHVAGRTASETAVHEFVRHLGAVPGGRPSLVNVRQALRSANRAILERVRADPYLKGMGTTLCALAFRGESAIIAHVGDSRIYLLREGRLHLLSLDHSYVCELVFRKQLKPEAARRHPNRHVITRALGVLPAAEPDVAQLRVWPGDRFVLCTDGVTGAVDDDEIADMLRRGGRDLRGIVGALIDCANTRGGQDNATVVVVDVLG